MCTPAATPMPRCANTYPRYVPAAERNRKESHANRFGSSSVWAPAKMPAAIRTIATVTPDESRRRTFRASHSDPPTISRRNRSSS